MTQWEVRSIGPTSWCWSSWVPSSCSTSFLEFSVGKFIY